MQRLEGFDFFLDRELIQKVIWVPLIVFIGLKREMDMVVRKPVLISGVRKFIGGMNSYQSFPKAEINPGAHPGLESYVHY